MGPSSAVGRPINAAWSQEPVAIQALIVSFVNLLIVFGVVQATDQQIGAINMFLWPYSQSWPDEQSPRSRIPGIKSSIICANSESLSIAAKRSRFAAWKWAPRDLPGYISSGIFVS